MPNQQYSGRRAARAARQQSLARDRSSARSVPPAEDPRVDVLMQSQAALIDSLQVLSEEMDRIVEAIETHDEQLALIIEALTAEGAEGALPDEAEVEVTLDEPEDYEGPSLEEIEALNDTDPVPTDPNDLLDAPEEGNPVD